MKRVSDQHRLYQPLIHYSCWDLSADKQLESIPPSLKVLKEGETLEFNISDRNQSQGNFQKV